MKSFWNAIKHYAFTFVGAMIMEPKNGGQGISLGRVCFLGVLIILSLGWLKSLGGEVVETPESLLKVWYVLAGYVLGGKVVDTVKTRMSRVKHTMRVGDHATSMEGSMSDVFPDEDKE